MHSIDNKAIWPGWETVRLLGRGSFGAVYEIERDVLGEKEKAALKVITIPQNSSDVDEMYSDGYDDESITETFKSYLKSIVAEYSLMRKLNSSANVVKCDDVRYVPHDDGFAWDIFIKMELLTPLTAAFPALPDDAQVLKLGADLCQALVRCKKLDIVHRDIKPQNIFVSPLGDYKLGDFGIAKTVEKTSGGTKIGTYKYMAPEVYNNQPYGAGADIYSLGLVLYWLLNERRMPFLPLPPEKLRVGQEEAARQRRLGGEALPAPAHGSEALKRIVLKACAYDPKDRWQSAEELLRALQALDGRAVPALDPKPETVPEPSAAPAVDEDDERTVSAFGQGASDKQSEEKNQSEPATLSENAAEDEDAEEKTVSVFSRPIGEATGTKPPAAPSPEADERTVMEFASRSQEPKPRAAEEEGTVGVFGRGGREKAAPPEHAPEQENGTVTVLDQATSGAPAAERLESEKPETNAPDVVLEKKAKLDDNSDHWILWGTAIIILLLVSCAIFLWLQKYHTHQSVDWSFYEITGTLTINKNINDLPWVEYKDQIRNVVIADGVTSIGDFAFNYCSSLTSISIPDSVTSIGDYAFNCCSSLTSISIPDSVTSIGHYAFSGCRSLTSISIPDGVTSIGDFAFNYCSSLTSISIPASVTEIGKGAFGNCYSLTDIYYGESEEAWKQVVGSEQLPNLTIHYNAG